MNKDIARCPNCGSTEIGKGRMEGPAPEGKLFASVSTIITDICTDCGLILQFKVDEPQRFKKRV